MKKIIFLIAIIPAIYLLIKLFVLQDVEDPIKYIYTVTGTSALVLLFATTSISMWYKKWMKYRRMIGLFGFFYALLHTLNFLILDMDMDLGLAWHETLDKPFIYLGMISFFLLLFMAVTSTRKLFKKYRKYHKLLYGVLAMTTIHFVMAQKSLSLEQYFYLGIIGVIALSKLNKELKLKKRILNPVKH